jgi:hypothetical protein
MSYNKDMINKKNGQKLKKLTRFDSDVNFLLSHTLIHFGRNDGGLDKKGALSHIDNTTFPEDVKQAVRDKILA